MEQGNGTKKKTAIISVAIGVICVAISGCGGQESSTGGTQGSEQSAEEFLEQLDEEYQEMVEAEEEQHEAELEAEYPEGILPAGKYRLPEELQDVPFRAKIDAQYDPETGEGTITANLGCGDWETITDEFRGGNADSYRYDPETGLYHFDLYYWNHNEGKWFVAATIEGYFDKENDGFILTYYYCEEMNLFSDDGYEQVYYRE